MSSRSGIALRLSILGVVTGARERGWRSLAVAGLFALAGCGGGGGGDAGTSQDPPARQASNVRAAGSVPAAGVALAVRVVAPTVGATYGDSVPLRSLPSGVEQPVLALDREGRIVFAAMTSGTEVEFDAAGTAQALVRLAYGIRLGQRSTAHLQADIRASASFPALVEAVRASWMAGLPPSEHGPVQQRIRTTLRELAIARSQGLATTDRRQRALTVATPTVEELDDKPYRLLTGWSHGAVFLPQNPGQLGRAIGLPGALRGGQVDVQNATPIHWTAMTREMDGRLHEAVLLRPTDFVERSLDSLARVSDNAFAQWLLAVDRQALAVGSGDHFNLRLVQDRSALLHNLTALLSDTIGVVLGSKRQGTCGLALLDVLANAAPLQGFLEAPSWTGLREVLRTSLIDIIRDAFNAATGSDLREACLDAGSVVDHFMESLKAQSRYLSGLLATTEIVQQVAGVVELVDQWGWLAGALGTDRWIGVCVGEGYITNCTHQFRFAESLLLLAPGTSHLPSFVALDRFGGEVAMPAQLRFEVEPMRGALDAATGRVTMPAAFGPDLTLRVRDPGTGAEGTTLIRVAVAQMRPTAVVMTVGDHADLDLVDNEGRLVRHDERYVEWCSSDDKVVIVDRLFTPLFGSWPNSARIIARQPGRASVRFWNAFDPRGEPLQADVVVRGAPPTAVLDSTPNPSAIGASVRFNVRLTADANHPDAVRPTGEVQLRDQTDGRLLCVADVGPEGVGACEATFDGPARLAGVVAAYQGDGVYLPTENAGTMQHAIGLVPTRVAPLRPQTSPVLGTLGLVQALVERDAAHQAGWPSITGEVELALGQRTCRGVLQAQSGNTAIASCSLIPDKAGAQLALTARYVGDAAHAPSDGAISIAVDRGLPRLQATALAFWSYVYGPSVEAELLLDLVGLPGVDMSGAFELRGDSGVHCIGAVNSLGTGRCSFAVDAGARSSQYEVRYAGNSQLQPASLTVQPRQMPIEVGPVHYTARLVRFDYPAVGNYPWAEMRRDEALRMYCFTRPNCLNGARVRVRVTTSSYTHPTGPWMQVVENEIEGLAFREEVAPDGSVGFYEVGAGQSAFLHQLTPNDGADLYVLYGMPGGGYVRRSVVWEIWNAYGDTLLASFSLNPPDGRPEECRGFPGAPDTTWSAEYGWSFWCMHAFSSEFIPFGPLKMRDGGATR